MAVISYGLIRSWAGLGQGGGSGCAMSPVSLSVLAATVGNTTIPDHTSTVATTTEHLRSTAMHDNAKGRHVGR